MSVVATLLLLLVLALAVRDDVNEQRIPNEVVVAGLFAASVLAVADHGLGGLLGAVTGALAGAAVMLPLHLKGGMGAGDVKLMAAVGAFLGPWDAMLAALFALVVGAVQGVLIVIARFQSASGSPLASHAQSDPHTSRGLHTLVAAGQHRFPYAVAVAVGTTLLLAYRGALGALFVSLGLG